MGLMCSDPWKLKPNRVRGKSLHLISRCREWEQLGGSSDCAWKSLDYADLILWPLLPFRHWKKDEVSSVFLICDSFLGYVQAKYQFELSDFSQLIVCLFAWRSCVQRRLLPSWFLMCSQGLPRVWYYGSP